MEIEIIETKHLCPICQKDFKNIAQKNFHMKKKHMNKGSYKCKHCEKKFTQSEPLKAHERIHTGEYFVCSYCAKKFAILNRLKDHERFHTGEKS